MLGIGLPLGRLLENEMFEAYLPTQCKTSSHKGPNTLPWISDDPDTVVLSASLLDDPFQNICVHTCIGTQACRTSSAHSDRVALEVLAKGPLLAPSYTTQMWSSTTAHRFQICSMKLATVEGEEKVKATTEKNWTQPKCNVVILSWIHWISISQCLSSFSG